jgi:PKD repeat protein
MLGIHKLAARAVLILAVSTCAWLALAREASAASSQPYGELTRFGVGGPGEALGTLNDEHRTRLLGVDTAERNSAFVLDEPAPEQQEEKKVKVGKPGCPEEPEEPEQEPCEIGVGPITRHFRLQKFNAPEGAYSPVAQVPFAEEAPWPAKLTKPTGPELELAAKFEEEVGRSRGLTVEGIAVDPELGRVYVLTVDYRLPTLPVDNSAGEPPLLERKALLVASTLYAYSTATLAPAVGANPVLASSVALGAQSATPGAALLEPAGITVDPATHEVIVLAHVDESGAALDRIESGSDHYVLQRIRSDGTLGARYVDHANFFAKEPKVELRPNSPVVVGSEKGERVLVAYKREFGAPSGVVEVPSNFESSEAPKTFFTPPTAKTVEEWVKAPFQSNGPASFGPLVGGALSASPEGTIFGAGVINNEAQSAGYQGVVALSGANASVIGWTGGQAQNPEAPPEERYRCVIEPLFYNPATPIAAGSGGDVFVLAPAYLFDRSLAGPHEIELYGPPSAPAVIEFGPGGAGCPQAKSRELTATKGGVPLEGRPVNEGENVGFTTNLSQADAIKVEWDFGDGTKETNVPKKPQEPEAKHAFAHSGKLIVTATIYTDDLATPTITLTTHVTVEGEHKETKEEEEERKQDEEEEPKKETKEEEEERKQDEEEEKHKEGSGPQALGVGPEPAYLGRPALFDGSASYDVGAANQIAQYHWSFGDGEQYSGPQAIVFHTYRSANMYEATLTVTDRRGLMSGPYLLKVKVVPFPVKEQSSPEQPPGAGVAGYTHALPSLPVVTISSALLSTTKQGKVSLVLYCPASERSCAGTVMVRAAVALVGRKLRRLKAPLTVLAKGSFALVGGKQKRITLTLSRQARALLTRRHELLAQVLIIARDPAGATHTTTLPVVVRAPRSKR